MKMTSLAKFFRFCGFGIAFVTVILGVGALSALPQVTDPTPFYFVIVGLIVLLVFAVSWIIHSFFLEREGAKIDHFYAKAIADYEDFARSSREWTERQVAEARADVAG